MGARSFYWCDLTSRDFDTLDAANVVAVVPVAAIEQHGPHLPVSTDTSIAEGMLSLLRERMPADLGVLALPTVSVGKSNEHLLSAGTLSLSSETLTRVMLDLAESVVRAGLRKMIIISSHGGNDDLMAVIKREIRVRFECLVVATHWHRFGLPPGHFTAEEERYGIHGGDIETSLMRHFRPDLVRMDLAQNFVSSQAAIEREFKLLSPEGPHAFGWIAQDLNAEGVVGNARLATAEKGRLVAEHQVNGFIELVRDVSQFSLQRLHTA